MKPLSTKPLLGLTAAILISMVSAAHADDETGPRMKPGEVVKDFYRVVANQPGFGGLCGTIVRSLNVPKVYDPYYRHELYLGTDYNYLWKRQTADGRWEFPATTKDLRLELEQQEGSPNLLNIDLDEDGIMDDVYRTLNFFASQAYTSIVITRKPADQTPATAANDNRELITRQTLESNLVSKNDLAKAGDFYLIDILRVDGHNYVLAASSIASTSEGANVSAFVVKILPEGKVDMLCYLKSNFAVP